MVTVVLCAGTVPDRKPASAAQNHSVEDIPTSIPGLPSFSLTAIDSVHLLRRFLSSLTLFLLRLAFLCVSRAQIVEPQTPCFRQLSLTLVSVFLPFRRTRVTGSRRSFIIIDSFLLYLAS
jgi:hypothetical protein